MSKQLKKDKNKKVERTLGGKCKKKLRRLGDTAETGNTSAFAR